MSKNKVVTVREMADKAAFFKREGKRVVLCHGVFDLLHIGHIRYFRQARERGDVLAVTLTPDRFVDKGPGRPAFNESLRAEAVASVADVDLVALNEWPTAEQALRMVRPDVYAKGAEFKDLEDRTGKIGVEYAVVEEVGAEMAFIEDIVFSSSNLINRYFSSQPKEVLEYLGLFRQRHGLGAIQSLLDRMRGLRVLVVGETIIDEYESCEPLGKSSKDPILAIKHQTHEAFAGGALAVANHLAGFCDQVELVSVLGDRDRREDFVRASLLPQVRAGFVTQDQAPTIVKRRYIDGYTLNKLLEIYHMNDSGLSEAREAELRALLKQALGRADVVVVADYGHGMISNATAVLLSEKASFLAVNTQANAGNRGFHTVTKYPRADFVSLAHHEIKLEYRNNRTSLREMIDQTAEKLAARAFVVTTGRRGCSVRMADQVFVEVPSFAQQVVDRIGAGDAFLSVAAMAAHLGGHAEVIGLLGNMAGAMAVQVVGNKKSIDRQSLEKFATAILK